MVSQRETCPVCQRDLDPAIAGRHPACDPPAEATELQWQVALATLVSREMVSMEEVARSLAAE